MKIIKILLPLFLFSSFCMRAKESSPDSLLSVYSKAASDTAKISALKAITNWYFTANDFDKAQQYSDQLMAFSKNTGSGRGMGFAWEFNGLIADAKSNFDGAIENYKQAFPLFSETEDAYELAALNQNIANSYYSKGTNDKALQHYMKSLKIREEMADSNAIASSYMGISNVYGQMHRHDLAFTYAQKALRLKEKYHQAKIVSWLLNNIGAILLDKGDTVAALPYYLRSVEIKKSLGDDYGLATTYKNIGTIHLRKKQFSTALNYYREALGIRFRMNPDDAFEIAVSYDDIGSVYMDMGQNDSAAFYIKKAIVLAEKTNSYELLRVPYFNMAQTLAKQGKYEEAYEYALKHLAAKDSTLSSETNSLMTEMAAKYDNEKKEQQISLQELEIGNQKKSKMFLLLLVALAVILTIVMLRGYLNKKKANDLLEEKNTLIEQQKKIVEEKNKDITDSIHYAQRIQKAILPSTEFQQKLIPGSFTLFKPKDIVSGDFYWMEQWGNKIIVACVDCTGHGVPGAFMTFVTYSLLNECVLEHGIDSPAAILNELRRNLNKMLRQKNDAEALKDGMDISVCAFDLSSMQLEYAGAFNPLWIIRENELKEIKADKQPIGVFVDAEPKPFSNHVIELKKGDVFYLFTDGYADQFGGEKGKKFKYKSLQNLLLSVHQKPAQEQKQELENTFEKWRSNLEQVDDVCIIGVKI